METKFSIKHVDGKKDKRVNVADMIAGAVLASETGKNQEFYAIISEKIMSIKKLHWREVKQSVFEKQKLA